MAVPAGGRNVVKSVRLLSPGRGGVGRGRGGVGCGGTGGPMARTRTGARGRGAGGGGDRSDYRRAAGAGAGAEIVVAFPPSLASDVLTDADLLSIISGMPSRGRSRRPMTKKASSSLDMRLYMSLRACCRQMRDTLPLIEVVFPQSRRIRELDAWLRDGDDTRSRFWPTVDHVFLRASSAPVPYEIAHKVLRSFTASRSGMDMCKLKLTTCAELVEEACVPLGLDGDDENGDAAAHVADRGSPLTRMLFHHIVFKQDVEVGAAAFRAEVAACARRRAEVIERYGTIPTPEVRDYVMGTGPWYGWLQTIHDVDVYMSLRVARDARYDELEAALRRWGVHAAHMTRFVSKQYVAGNLPASFTADAVARQVAYDMSKHPRCWRVYDRTCARYMHIVRGALRLDQYSKDDDERAPDHRVLEAILLGEEAARRSAAAV